jgi:TetR/AcrR family transcriptional regulator
MNQRTRGAIRATNEEQILHAAEAVFAERGFTGATTSAIAERASLPKANVHYYFRTKEILYRAVLADILDLWLESADVIHEGADPADALATYIAAKIRYSRKRPNASKVFANELLHGAPHLIDYLRADLRGFVAAKAAVMEGWIAAGRMAPIDPRHLFFLIWAATQTYADFDCQVAAVLGRESMGEDDFATATEAVTSLVLRGCGVKID